MGYSIKYGASKTHLPSEYMRRFQIEQSATEFYTSHSGLALIGLAINRHTSLKKTLRTVVKRHGIPNIELIRSYVGQLSIGKSDFDAIENVRDDRYFKQTLDIKQMPSSARLRQRFDEDSRALIPLIDDACVEFVKRTGAPVTPLRMGHVPLDMDGFPVHNSGTSKEGVSRTCKGHDGYVPMAAYLGREGWNIGMELREGSWHGQREFGYVLDRVLPRARTLAGSEKVLLRLDGGHDAKENRERLVSQEGVDFLIKWNPRKQDPKEWLLRAERGELPDEGVETASDIDWQTPREGKRIATIGHRIEECYTQGPNKGQTYSVRRVIRIIERTINKEGQALLIPDVTLEGWWTTLDEASCDNETIINLYKDHATSEQYHSEFKTDLDLERLPSGKFDTNDLVLTLGALTYNILRWIGLMGLTGELSPVRHPAKRRRIRTVMQELMYLAARLIASGRQLLLRFSRHCPGFKAFEHVYNRLAYG